MKYHVTIQLKDGTTKKTWGIFPIGQTKILDGIYNPEEKHLSLLFDSATEQYTPVRTKDDKGKITESYRKIDTYYKFELPEEDLSFFLENYVENNFEFVPELTPALIMTEQND